MQEDSEERVRAVKELAQMRQMGYNLLEYKPHKVDHGATSIARGLSPERELLMNHNDTSGASAFKICSKCKEPKPLSEFYQFKSGRSAGNYYSYCRECACAISREKRANDPDYHLKYWSEYSQRNRATLRAKQRAHYNKNREFMVERMRRARQEDPEKAREVIRRNRAKNPEKHKAQEAVRYAVRVGKLPPVWTMVCEECQEAQAQHYHHHNGYAPEHKLDVLALCIACHGQAHWLET